MVDGKTFEFSVLSFRAWNLDLWASGLSFDPDYSKTYNGFKARIYKKKPKRFVRQIQQRRDDVPSWGGRNLSLCQRSRNMDQIRQKYRYLLWSPSNHKTISSATVYSHLHKRKGKWSGRRIGQKLFTKVIHWRWLFFQYYQIANYEIH